LLTLFSPHRAKSPASESHSCVLFAVARPAKLLPSPSLVNSLSPIHTTPATAPPSSPSPTPPLLRASACPSKRSTSQSSRPADKTPSSSRSRISTSPPPITLSTAEPVPTPLPSLPRVQVTGTTWTTLLVEGHLPSQATWATASAARCPRKDETRPPSPLPLATPSLSRRAREPASWQGSARGGPSSPTSSSLRLPRLRPGRRPSRSTTSRTRGARPLLMTTLREL
jgi:hypothetical protein